MAAKIVAVNVRLEESLVERIDHDLEKVQRTVLGVRLTRSDWVRAAIEMKLVAIAETVERKKRRKPFCYSCGRPITKKNGIRLMDHPDGSPEHMCVTCAASRPVPNLPPK